MQTMDYQTPSLWILTFEQEDVITTSGGTTHEDKAFDKGVEDFF